MARRSGNPHLTDGDEPVDTERLSGEVRDVTRDVLFRLQPRHARQGGPA